jgi:hypothetical protein
MSESDLGHHIPGYTGFIPASQHVVAMTFGQATTHLLRERTANADPSKWRKHVSYAEFTPPRTPIEKHHMPGYAGFVPGVIADSGQLFGKTFGKMTLKAIKGGYEGSEDKERMSSVEKDMLAEAAGSHPAESRDFKEGGSSWTGASPYRDDLDYTVGTIQPHQPQSWGLATGAEPWRESALLERMKRKGHKPSVDRPSVRYYAKNDPCDPTDPEKKILSSTPEPHHIPGYSGFMPGILSDSIFGETYAKATHTAHVLREQAGSRPSSNHVSIASIDPDDGVIPYRPRTGLPRRHSEFKTTARPDKQTAISKHVPGYTGFIPGVISESMYGKTFPQQSITAIEGDKRRFHFTALEPDAQYVTEVKDAFRNFGRSVPRHLGTDHADANSNQMDYMRSTPSLTKLVDDKVHHHMPGYGGFVPGVYAKNVYGRTFYKVRCPSEAITSPSHAHHKPIAHQKAMAHQKPTSTRHVAHQHSASSPTSQCTRKLRLRARAHASSRPLELTAAAGAGCLRPASSSVSLGAAGEGWEAPGRRRAGFGSVQGPCASERALRLCALLGAGCGRAGAAASALSSLGLEGFVGRLEGVLACLRRGEEAACC